MSPEKIEKLAQNFPSNETIGWSYISQAIAVQKFRRRFIFPCQKFETEIGDGQKFKLKIKTSQFNDNAAMLTFNVQYYIMPSTGVLTGASISRDFRRM